MQMKDVKKFLKSKKGLGFGDLVPIATTLGAAGITFAVVALVLVAVDDSTTNATVGHIVGNITNAFSNFANQLGTVGTLIGVGLLAAVGFGIFYFGRSALGSTRR